MTKAEHKLIIGVLATQHQMIMTLVELLRSRGLIESGDLAAFSSLVSQQDKVSLRKTKEAYLFIAKQMDILTGLEPPTKG